MRLGESCIKFCYAGIDMLGNLDTGSIIALTPEGSTVCFEALQENVPKECFDQVDERLYPALQEGGFDGSKGRSSTQLRSAYFHVTQRCNLRCRGCYSEDAARNSSDDAPFGQVCHGLDELAANGVKTVVISGGEPFIRADIVDIARYAKEQCHIPMLVVLSNGTLLTRRVLEDIAPFIDVISISFDGASPQDDAYIRRKQLFGVLVDAVRLAKECGIKTNIIPTIHAKNIDALPSYIDLAESLGSSMNFSLLTRTHAFEDEESLIPDQEQLDRLGMRFADLDTQGICSFLDAPIGKGLSVQNSCGAGARLVSVAYDGTVYPCHMLHNPQFRMGNIFESPLAEMLACDVAKELRTSDVSKISGCSECAYCYLCGGGCRARAWAATGSLCSRDPYCAFLHRFFCDVEQAWTSGGLSSDS